MADNESGEVAIRDFASLLLDLPGAHHEASMKVHEVVQAVRDTKKAGSVTFTLKIAPGKLDESTLDILPDVVAKIPRLALRGGVFYPDDDGNPTKDDPAALWRGDDIRSAPTFREDDTKIKGAPQA